MENNMNHNRLYFLLDKYFRKEHTPEEKTELFALLANPANELAVKRWIDKGFEEKLSHEMDAATQQDILQSIVQVKIPEVEISREKPERAIPSLKTTWIKYAAAILLLVGTVAYLWFRNHQPDREIVTTLPEEKDFQPGGQKAILSLSDGRQIILDSAANGELAKDQGHPIFKQNGQILYSEAPTRGAAISFNTMATPRGGQYRLTLEDGTKVWLNAASRITYPITFNGKKREVEVTGEVYLEVAKDPAKPFIVKAGKDQILVLGTAFNIHYYPEDPVQKISLVNGSIKVNDKIVQPQQAWTNGSVVNTDISQDIAWKSGVFNFENMNIQQAMRQLARWYDLDIQYQRGQLPDIEFGGKMGMDLKLSQVLKGLEVAGLKFRTGPGKQLIITQ